MRLSIIGGEDPRNIEVSLNGENITRFVRSIEFHAAVDERPSVKMEFMAIEHFDIEIDVPEEHITGKRIDIEKGEVTTGKLRRQK